MEQKMCCRCKILKSHIEFHKDKSVKSGLCCRCKKCDREKAMLYWQKNKKRLKYSDKQCNAIIKGKICSNNFKGGNYSGLYYCSRHHTQLRKYGKILQRTIMDKNEIITKDDICEMNLYNYKCQIVAKTIFSKRHLDKVKKYKWSLGGRGDGYVCTKINSHQTELQRFLKGEKDGFIVHHKDGNTLNNLDENLAFATVSQNGFKRKVGKNNKSGVIGVSFNKNENKYVASIVINQKHIHLGYFKTLEKAKKARLEAEKKYFDPILNSLDITN